MPGRSDTLIPTRPPRPLCLACPPGRTWDHLLPQGYTSLGSVNDTRRNEHLRRADGTYAPAWELADGAWERDGRRARGQGSPTDGGGGGNGVSGDGLVGGGRGDVRWRAWLSRLPAAASHSPGWPAVMAAGCLGIALGHAGLLQGFCRVVLWGEVACP